MTMLNGKNTCLVMCFDESYLNYAAVTLLSLLDNYNLDEPLDVVCLVPGVLVGREKALLDKIPDSRKLRVEFRHPEEVKSLESSRDFKSLLPSGFNSIAIYRLFMPSSCPEFDKALYVDSDVLIVSDISNLLSMEMVQPVHAFHEQLQVEYPRVIGIDNDPYFNDGVLLVDLEQWRAGGFDKQIESLVVTHDSSKTKAFEMDILNIVFRGKWFPLSIKYNYFHAYEEWGPAYSVKDPVIVHFISNDIKPWSESHNVETRWKKRWLWYYKQLQLDNS